MTRRWRYESVSASLAEPHANVVGRSAARSYSIGRSPRQNEMRLRVRCAHLSGECPQIYSADSNLHLKLGSFLNTLLNKSEYHYSGFTSRSERKDDRAGFGGDVAVSP
jgi:hypothetical protein